MKIDEEIEEEPTGGLRHNPHDFLGEALRIPL